jgi:hypothetical protein
MFQVVVTADLRGFTTFGQRMKLLSDGRWKLEASRGVEAAGKKTKTQVQRAVHNQMAVAPGNYQSYVVANTMGMPNRQMLSYTIRASMKGTDIKVYKGLSALSTGGRTAKRYNAGRTLFDKGFVKSGVWNNPRTFKRSFAQGGQYLSLIPGNGSGRMPKQLWTFGSKPNQPRGANGRFGKSGQPGWKIRRLYGPALGKELPKDQSLQTFITFGPRELEDQVLKRIGKLLNGR